jgi:histone-lysine N-methyltransferase SETMAR
MKAGSTTSSPKQTGQAKNGTIPPPQNPKPKKFRTQVSAGKVMLTMFWDHQDPFVEHYMSKGTTVTSATYCDLLRNYMKPAIRSKHRGLLSTRVLLQHDNARPHTTHVTAVTFEDMHFKCLPHPPNSPDLTPSDYHIFGPLKGAISGKTFHSDEEVQEAVHEWLRTQPKEFFQEESRH